MKTSGKKVATKSKVNPAEDKENRDVAIHTHAGVLSTDDRCAGRLSGTFVCVWLMSLLLMRMLHNDLLSSLFFFTVILTQCLISFRNLNGFSGTKKTPWQALNKVLQLFMILKKEKKKTYLTNNIFPICKSKSETSQ